QVADHPETEEPLVSGDVADRRGRVLRHKQLAGNIDKPQWADDDEEQVPESGDSPWIGCRAHVLRGQQSRSDPMSERLGVYRYGLARANDRRNDTTCDRSS